MQLGISTINYIIQQLEDFMKQLETKKEEKSTKLFDALVDNDVPQVDSLK